jgi:hypothetical protein
MKTDLHRFVDREGRFATQAAISPILTHLEDFHKLSCQTHLLWNKRLKQLNETLRKITNKVLYIRSILEDKLDLRRKKLEEIVHALKTLKIEEHEGSYHYLIKMPMDSVTEEKVTELEKEHDTLQKQIHDLTKTSIQTLWERELNVLKKCI